MLFHGYSHGAELPASDGALAYGAGFIVATFVLHAIGLTLGGLSRASLTRLAPRTVGAMIAAVGVVLLVTA